MNWRDWFSRPSGDVERHVQFYTRSNCPLCEEAMVILRKHAPRWGLVIEVIDIEGDAVLEERFGMEIPVVFIDGRRRFFGRVDEVLLRRILERPRQGGAE